MNMQANITYSCSHDFYQGIKELARLGVSFEAYRDSLTIQIATSTIG